MRFVKDEAFSRGRKWQSVMQIEHRRIANNDPCRNTTFKKKDLR